MKANEKLYETLGELLYAVAKADGVIQKEETDKLDQLLASHPWVKEIKWSFNYEVSKNSSVEEIYKKVISFCQGYGPSIVYPEFIDSMKAIAKEKGLEIDYLIDETQEIAKRYGAVCTPDPFLFDSEKKLIFIICRWHRSINAIDRSSG